MLSESIIICGVVKNCEKILDVNLKQCIETGSLFKDYHVIIYENNSTDHTKNILYSYKSNPKFTILSEDIPYEMIKKKSKIWTFTSITGSDHPCRIEQICNARNKVLDEINLPKYDSFDYVMFIDLDGNGWETHSLSKIFKEKNEWDVLYANGIEKNGTYYDMYAYRNENIYGPEILGDSFWTTMSSFRIAKNHPRICVHSAFGGIGIFKKEIFKTHKYECIVNDEVKNFIYNRFDSIKNVHLEIIKNKCKKFPSGIQDQTFPIFWKANSGYDQPVICEHVCLNYELINHGYKIFIEPNLIYYR
jgi:hypothetical protein